MIKVKVVYKIQCACDECGHEMCMLDHNGNQKNLTFNNMHSLQLFFKYLHWIYNKKTKKHYCNRCFNKTNNKRYKGFL